MVKRVKERQQVPFRLLQCPKCHTLLCWVNPRLPNYCPECGKWIMMEIKSNVLQSYHDAWLIYEIDSEEKYP
jgi:ribosomal protein S27E